MLFTIAIVCYILGILCLSPALLLCLLGADKNAARRSNLGIATVLYELRKMFRWGYVIFLSLGGLLHYLSLS